MTKSERGKPSPKEILPPSTHTIEHMKVVPATERTQADRTSVRNIVLFEYIKRFAKKDPKTDNPAIEPDRVMKFLYPDPAAGPQNPDIEFLGEMKFTYGGKTYERDVGTIRLLRGVNDPKPVEAAQFFSRPDGWQRAPQEICELGRLAFMPFNELHMDDDGDEAKAIKRKFIRELTGTAAKVALNEYGCTKMVAIMPEPIIKAYRKLGIEPRLVEGAELIEEGNTELFDTFPGYWREEKKMNPKLYEWDLPELVETLKKQDFDLAA